MTEYTHEKIEAAIESVTSDATNPEIASLLADYLTLRPSPFTLTINHNGKVSPCPIRIDKVMAKGCVVVLKDAKVAHAWIVDALSRGYEVSRLTHRGHETRSIANVRRSIEHRAQMAEWRAKRDAGDDSDIPF